MAKRTMAAVHGDYSVTVAKQPRVSQWQMGLLNSVKDPEFLVFQDDLLVVIKDKYPKVTT